MGHACRHILVAEDDPDLLAAIGEFLEAEGIEPTLCGSAAALVELVAAGRPRCDAILLDATLDGAPMDALLQRLRSHPGWGEVPVAVMSGHPLRRFAYLPADAFLEKPFELDRLNDVLRRLCARATGSA